MHMPVHNEAVDHRCVLISQHFDSSGDTWNSLMTLNTWHKLKVTFDSTGTTTVYIDGNTPFTSTAAPNYGRVTDWILTIGNFDGDVDEVRISHP